MRYTKEDILQHVRGTIEALFEVAATDISPDARLVEDLDIDSIDAVELMIELKNITGKKMPQEVFSEVRTVNDVVEAVYALLQEP